MTGDHNIDVAGGRTQPVERRLVGAHLIGPARVEGRDQDVGEHAAGEQDATVCEDDRGVVDGVRLMLDDLARQGEVPSAGSGVRSPISSGGMPDALSAAICCPRSRAAPAPAPPAPAPVA